MRRCCLPISFNFAVVEAYGRIVADPMHKLTPAALRAELEYEIERFPGARIANTSLWQKAYCDERLVAQTIRVALTRYS